MSKHKNQFSKFQQLRIDDSMLGVYPKRTHGFGLWGNERVPFTVRVDKGLKKRFVDASVALFGSTCNPIECYMAAIVGVYQSQRINGVYPQLTVDIGAIKIERNLRERRKITKTVETETEKTVTVQLKRCGIAKCRSDGKLPGVAVASGVYLSRNETYDLCATHAAEFKQEPLMWKVNRGGVG